MSRRACELKAANWTFSVLSVYRLDVEEILGTVRPKVESAPELLRGAGLVVDLGAPQLRQLAPEPLSELLAGLRACGMYPIAISADEGLRDLAADLGLPLISRARTTVRAPGGNAHMREQESIQEALPLDPPPVPAPAPPPPEPEPIAEPEPVVELEVEATPAPSPPPPARPTLVVQQAVRAGQQVYAQGRDLVVLGQVNAGAEIAADGSIHVYGRLAGRALAGAQGATDARIFALQFSPELVSVAGHYRLSENLDPALQGQAVQVRLDQEQLVIGRIGP